nr:hypothetical protein [Pseudonocardiales bacterium]
GRERLAVEFENVGRGLGLPTPARAAMAKAIYRHETGRATVRDDVYVQLYCAVYNATPHELFGVLTTEVSSSQLCELTSHQFIPVHLGPELAAELVRAESLDARDVLWADCHSGVIDLPGDGSCELYVFPWGVAVFHLVQDLHMPSVAQVAAWRRDAYRSAQEWATTRVRSATGSDTPAAQYVMSMYWVRKPLWSGPALDTAMRLLSMPRVLLGRADEHGDPALDHAEQVERTLLRDGFDDSRIDEFGVKGVSIGCASWAGLSYFPLAPQRALQARDLVDCELLVQALWCYCHGVHQQVEQGLDPTPPPEYGWRWLRAMRSRLTIARPRETAQHVALRQAVLETSELAKHLTAALDLLRETGG